MVNLIIALKKNLRNTWRTSLLPSAFASGTSKFRTAQITQHLLTNAEVIRVFGVAEITLEKEHGKEGTVRVVPAERSLQRRR